MNKNNKIISIFLLLIAIILIILGIVFNNKNKPLLKGNTESNDSTITTTKSGIIKCSKIIEDIDTYTYIEENIINSDKNGNFVNNINKQIYKYKDEEIYQQYKKSIIELIDKVEMLYNDSEKTVTYSRIIEDIYNSKNEKTDISVKEYKETLEANGYTCQEE